MYALKRLFLAFFLVFLFAIRYLFVLPEFDEGYVGFYRGKFLTIRGKVQEPQEDSMVFQRVILQVDAFKKFDQWYPLSGKIIVKLSRAETLEYGDIVILNGRLEETGRKDARIGALLVNPKMKILEKRQGNQFLALLFELKIFLVKRLQMFFPEPSASFAAGILLGHRTSIPREVIDDFRRTGLTHILALSGFNIVILISFIETLLMHFSRRVSSILSILMIIFFTILVGASASVIRAAVMGSLGLVARLVGRKSVSLRTLCITGYTMALIDPFIVFYDIGFQLSFAATAGLIVFAKRWEEQLRFLPNWLGVRDSFITTSAAQVFTFPLILFYFGGFSTVSLLSNFFVLPFIPWLMLGSFLSLFLGKIIAAPTWLLFEITLWLIHFLASLPFAYTKISF